jgi:hypothetical protein
MGRMIHYKTKERVVDSNGETKFIKIQTEDHNHEIGGNGILPKQGIEILLRKLSKVHNCTEDQIVICNIFDV